ncbi:MAG: hypothetical protein DA408_18270 [Bacteroidetes bacterium]|nr:MAG: hypothetical protein C7N36_04985 [Bacteroidota bacterium]PTM09484.1 MAG: hypothetical protein DA408_18270 [Bacteroidota bacterium]
MSVLWQLTAQQVSLSGQVNTQGGDLVSNYTIELVSATGSVIAAQTVGCDDDGYAFTNIPAGADYVLRLAKPNFILNGVSTFDLVQVARHLLGIQPLGNTYRIRAADVNDSGSISVLDMTIMRGLILGMLETMPGENWLFFANGNAVGTNGFPVDLSSDRTGVDFVAIKKGDVNESAVPCN